MTWAELGARIGEMTAKERAGQVVFWEHLELQDNPNYWLPLLMCAEEDIETDRDDVIPKGTYYLMAPEATW